MIPAPGGEAGVARRQGRPLGRRIRDALTMFLVTGLSLVLLVYVGYGEGKRTYGEFQIEKIAAQAGIVRNSMEAFLRQGLPMRQYPGFATLAGPIVDTDDVAGMIAYDPAGREVFRNIDRTSPEIPTPSGLDRITGDQTTTLQTDDYYQTILPLRGRFETRGSLVVTSWTSVVRNHLRGAFEPLLLVALALSAAFAVLVTLAGPRLAQARVPWLQIGYALAFLAMASFVIGTLVSLYAEGVQGKARALANALGQRVGEILEFKLSLHDFEGIDRAFAEYQRLNPDISAAALLVDDRVLIDTNEGKVGKPWISDPGTYEYVLPVGRTNSEATVSIAIAVPHEIVFRQVMRSVKNFAALFVASAFLAGLFLQVAASLQNAGGPASRNSGGAPLMRSDEELALGVVKPLFFIAVFVENMTYSFLPQWMQQVAGAAGLSAGFASAPFMAYYLFFALSLIPSGHFAQNFGPRALMHGGLVLAGLGLFALVLPVGFWGVVAARGVAGVGQGMLFIGVQSYILATASPARRTQANGIIVFGFQGGMISGMAIGSLLVTYMDPAGVFMLAGLLGCLTALYGITVVPAEPARRSAAEPLGSTLRRLFQDISCVLRNGQFMQTMLLIGIPAKAALTGVITFALPLLLIRQHYKQEDIGQIIMLYAIGVVVASRYVARFVDRTGRTAHVLAFGAAVSGIGMIAVGMSEANPLLDGILSGALPTLVVTTSVIVIGIAHGCVNAPVVTHIADLELARKIGVNSTTAAYRFLERLGHIAGPIITGQLFLLLGTSPSVVTWFGAATSASAALFLMCGNPQNKEPRGLGEAA
ncbi:MAG TPA: MFS transporter [Stellaceae bacterium]|nr:MFS transporter [Stellaceae bacterium]